MRNLTDEEINAIAERVATRTAEKAAKAAIDELEQRIIMQTGKAVLRKLFWVVGAISLAIIVWAANNGWIK